MNGSKTSVVICTRNRPDELERCLRSVSACEIPPLEILVVDQSTDDRTKNLVLDFARDTNIPVRHLRLSSAGQTIARNAGLCAVLGEIVAFTDDDCIADPRWIGVIERELADPEISCVCGRSQPANHDERPRQAMLSTLKHNRRIVARGRRNPIAIGRGNNMAFRKSDLLRLGGFNETIGVGMPIAAADDLDIFCRTLQSGETIIHAPDSIVFHDQPDDWRAVLRKKHGYSLSSAAVLGSRLRNGDLYSGALLAAKVLYEFVYLFCGGIIRLNRGVVAIGWNSFVGSLRGALFAFDSVFHYESRRLYRVAGILYRSRAFSPQVRPDEREPAIGPSNATTACRRRQCQHLQQTESDRR